MSSIPTTWDETGFIEVFDVQGGTQPPKSTFVYEPTEGYVRLLQIRDFGEKPVPTFIPDTTRLKKCEEEDILIARYGASLGRILTGMRGAYNVAMARVVIPEGIWRRYVYYLLNSESFQAPLRLVSRSAQNGFNKDDLAGFRIPIAPLPEQKRIAGKLEAVLGRVDACRGRLAHIPDLLKRFRQSVLAATTGRLTIDWREEQSSSRNDWEETNMGSILESKPRNGYSPRGVEFETPVKSLTLTATTSGRFRGDYFKYIDKSIPDDSHLWLEPGDVLVQRANTLEYVGVSALYKGKPKMFIYPDLMMKCRANKRTTPEYLHIILSSEPVRNFFRDNATGTAGNIPKINQGTVISAPILLPPTSEQLEIVRRVETLFAFADRIESQLANAKRTVDRLTPATLAKAFRGELVPQDPEDEPANILLERIKSERAKAPKVSKRRFTSGIKRTKASKEKATMTKSRYDDDVKDQPYLANLLKKAKKRPSAEELFKKADLPLVDFYKQLAWEVDNGKIRDDKEKLEAI